MRAQKLMKEIIECLDYRDFKSIDNKIDELSGMMPDIELSKLFSEFIYSEYTTFRAGYLAALLETIIKKKPELAQVNHPENFLFKLCIVTGSKDLYECFIEEAAEPFLKKKKKDDKDEYYIDLYATAIKLTDFFFPGYTKTIKGMDYNGAFSTMENNANICLINREDYEIMENVVENYNRIIGRRDIVSDLEKRTN